MSEIPILNLIDSNFLGGSEKYILGYAKRTSGSVKTAAATFVNQGSERSLFSQALALGMVESLNIPCANSYDPRQVTNLIALVRRKGFNIINSHGYRTNLTGLIASRILKIPIVATFHGWTSSDPKVRVFD